MEVFTGQDPEDWHSPVPLANHLAMSHFAVGREGCQEIGGKDDQVIELAKWRRLYSVLRWQRRSHLATPLFVSVARVAMTAMEISRKPRCHDAIETSGKKRRQNANTDLFYIHVYS